MRRTAKVVATQAILVDRARSAAGAPGARVPTGTALGTVNAVDGTGVRAVPVVPTVDLVTMTADRMASAIPARNDATAAMAIVRTGATAGTVLAGTVIRAARDVRISPAASPGAHVVMADSAIVTHVPAVMEISVAAAMADTAVGATAQDAPVGRGLVATAMAERIGSSVRVETLPGVRSARAVLETESVLRVVTVTFAAGRAGSIVLSGRAVQTDATARVVSARAAKATVDVPIAPALTATLVRSVTGVSAGTATHVRAAKAITAGTARVGSVVVGVMVPPVAEIVATAGSARVGAMTSAYGPGGAARRAVTARPLRRSGMRPRSSSVRRNCVLCARVTTTRRFRTR